MEDLLKQMLISAKIRFEGYKEIIEDLEITELKHDLGEYKELLKKEISPLTKKALFSRNEELLSLAQEVEDIYKKLIKMIEEKIAHERERKRGEISP